MRESFNVTALKVAMAYAWSAALAIVLDDESLLRPWDGLKLGLISFTSDLEELAGWYATGKLDDWVLSPNHPDSSRFPMIVDETRELVERDGEDAIRHRIGVITEVGQKQRHALRAVTDLIPDDQQGMIPLGDYLWGRGHG